MRSSYTVPLVDEQTNQILSPGTEAWRISRTQRDQPPTCRGCGKPLHAVSRQSQWAGWYCAQGCGPLQPQAPTVFAPVAKVVLPSTPGVTVTVTVEDNAVVIRVA